MPWCANDDIKLRYSERGSPDGMPVVLLPGLFFSRRLHERLARRLPDHRVLMLDVRGHGESSSPTEPGTYGWEQWASDVAALLDHLELDRAVVGGVSLGANVTIAFAADHVDRMAAAIIEGPVLEAGRAQANAMFTRQARLTARTAPLVRPVARWLAARKTPSPELAAIRDLLSRDPDAAVAVLEALLEGEHTLFRGVDALVEHAVPTLVIGNSNIVGPQTDELHAIADARELAARIPGAELVEVNALVDLPLNPARHAEIIGGFLSRLPAAARRTGGNDV